VAERLAGIHRRHERYDQAELWLRRAVELRPTLGRLWNALGIVQARLDEPERAAGSYRRSIELEPSQAAARFNLGLLLEREGEQGAAARRFREVLERDPRHMGARRHLVKILVDREAPEALEAARKLARVAGDDPKALATAGYAFLKGDRPDLAAGALERSLMVDPSSQAVRFNLGLAQLRLDRPGAASETFEELLERWPGDPKTRRFLERARERVRQAR
jgi:Flp pilus assembly protein TadD